METKWSPEIIQGGMGMFVSGPRLARAVSMCGQQGTLSGVCLERAMTHILQLGDQGGHLRRALSHFPFPDDAQKVLKLFFVQGGIPKGKAFRDAPIFNVNPSKLLITLTVCANFAFVWLAKEGHSGRISINYLEKIAMPHVYSITGAILAGVDFITMGAGIPLQIPSVIDAIVEGKTATYRIPVEGTDLTSHTMSFNPEQFFGGKLPSMKKPGFIPIIASNLLARVFVDKLPANQQVSGFVVEEPTAGGHNAPPRRPPDYGPKDMVDYSKLVELGIPFWIGGSYASPEKLAFAKSVGAQGVQVGSIFALCEESELDPNIKTEIRRQGFLGELQIKTDTRISPTGFPFKVVVLPGTISERSVLDARPRVCDKGALVVLYERPDGSVGYKCPSEPTEKYLAKGGKVEDTEHRGCICNGLLCAVGLNYSREPAVVTLGDDVVFLHHLMRNEGDSYTAAKAVAYMLGPQK